MSSIRFTCAIAVLVTAALGAAAPASAADRCSSIKMVIPNPAGGAGDVVTRIVGDKAASILGQSIVIENRAGATTTIGTDFVAKSKPDGCTLLSLPSSGLVVTLLRDNVPYNLQHDFTPIIGVGSFPMGLAVPGSSGLKTFADLTAAARSRPGVIYASGGNGSLAHLSAARLIKELHGSGNHIPFKGNPGALQALMGGEVQMFFPSTSEALPLVSSGRVRLLAVTSDTRMAAFTGVPTMKELGFPDFNPKLWYVFMAPAQTPASEMRRLHDAFTTALKDPFVQRRLADIGFTVDVKDAAAVSASMKSEAARWSKVIKENNITVD